MAGIGFNLQKILEQESFGSTLKAHFYSTLIVAGPWLMSILTIVCLGYFITYRIDVFDLIFFRTVIIYIFAFSLIVVGFFHFPLTRYLSDKLYTKEYESLIPTFITACGGLLSVQALMGIIFYVIIPGKPFLKVLTVFIYMTISLIWILMVFLTALRDYRAIVVSYGIGTLIAIVTAWYFGQNLGLEGYFLGYLLGHLTIVILWSARIFIEFNSTRGFDADFFPFMLQNKTLVFIGLFYNLAIWIDKIVLWLSPQATKITAILRNHPIYDSAVFFAFLTIIPALSLFLIQIETEFYRNYRRFYLGIINKATYSQIEILKKELLENIRASVMILLRYQGLISLAAIVFAPQLAELLKFSAVQIPVFRIATLGAFLHSLLLMTIIIILYFDLQKEALMVTGLFVATNALLTFVTTRLDISFLGYGYLTSTLISLAAAFYLLDNRLRSLEYLTFARQPIGVHREEGIGEIILY